MSKKFNSNQFNFRPTAMSAAMVEAGVQGASLFFVKEPKAMAINADGKRVVL